VAIHPREPGPLRDHPRPASIRERDRQITGRNRREHEPVLKRYERVCFSEGHPAARQAGLAGPS
jgi:hypothetical protein